MGRRRVVPLTTSVKKQDRKAELDRRRALLTDLVMQSRREEGVGAKLRPGRYFWSDALLTLLAKDPEAFFAKTGEPSDTMKLLADCISGKVLRERTQAFCDAVNSLIPGTCWVEGDQIRWTTGFKVEGEPVSEIDFFLAYDLLDKEDDGGQH